MMSEIEEHMPQDLDSQSFWNDHVTGEMCPEYRSIMSRSLDGTQEELKEKIKEIDQEKKSLSSVITEESRHDIQATMLNMEWIHDLPFQNHDMMEIKHFRENFSLTDISESPEKTQSTLVSDSCLVGDSFSQSWTLSSGDDEFNDIESSMNKSLNTSDNPDPATSTPQRNNRQNRPKYKASRPPDLIIYEAIDEDEHDLAVDVGECSPVRSPFPSLEENFDDSVLDVDDTPLPSHYDAPPQGLELDPRQAKVVHLLRRFGLSHFSFIFIEQEVDIDLFLTLTNEDLREIGIERKTDRHVLLSVIAECNKRY